MSCREQKINQGKLCLYRGGVEPRLQEVMMPTDTDIITGQPTVKQRIQRQEEQDRRLQSEAEAVEKALRTKSGKKIIELVEGQLARRIDELVGQDPKCQALIGILEEVGQKIAAGKAASQRILRRNLRVI
jgi:hypothetical protein